MADHGNPDLLPNPRLKAQDTGHLERKSFLDLPYEIRAMVYEDFFAAEFWESSKARPELGAKEGDPQLNRRMTAHDKVSLLLASKTVWEEALPFFHRLHEFQLRILDDRKTLLTFPLPHHIQQVLRVVAKVRLVDQRRALDKVSISNLGYYIAFLEREFTELKSLKTGIRIWHPNHHLHVIHELQQLWPRLDYLQLTAEYNFCGDVEIILRLITPGLKWSLVGENDWVQDHFFRRILYLDRAYLEKGVTEIIDRCL